MEEDYYSDDDHFVIDIILLSWTLINERKERNAKWVHARLDWQNHVQKEFHEKQFERTYRMSYESFVLLRDTLGDSIHLDPIKSMNSTPAGLIIPEIVETRLLDSPGTPDDPVHVQDGLDSFTTS